MSELKDRAAAQRALEEMADLIAKRTSQQAMLERGVNTLRNRFDPEIAQLTSRIQQREAWLKEWAGENPGEFVPETKYIEINGHRLGFRFAPARLEMLARQTAKKIKESVRKCFPKYLLTVTSTKVDVQSILADATAEKPALKREELAAMGYRIEREENFYVSLKAA